MINSTAEVDFDALVSLEQTFYDQGYTSGHAHGRIHGLIEGRALGREKGFEMWEELGFFEGFARTWRAVLVAQGKSEERTLTQIDHLLQLIAQFPRVNPSSSPAASQEAEGEVDIPRLFRQIRSRYKALCAIVGVRPTLRATDAVDGAEDEAAALAESDRPKGKKNVWTTVTRPSEPEGLSF